MTSNQTRITEHPLVWKGVRSVPFLSWKGGTVLYDAESSPIGLQKSISTRPEHEAIRTGENSQSPWYASLACLGLAFRNFRIYRLVKKKPDIDKRSAGRMVCRGLEAFGSFEINGLLDTASALFQETKLLTTCAYWMMTSNTIRYEIGYRWYHQTQFDKKFKEEFLDLFSVDPVETSLEQFVEDCTGVSNSPTPTEVSDDEKPETYPEEFTTSLTTSVIQALEVSASNPHLHDDFDAALEGLILKAMCSINNEDIRFSYDKLSEFFSDEGIVKNAIIEDIKVEPPDIPCVNNELLSSAPARKLFNQDGIGLSVLKYKQGKVKLKGLDFVINEMPGHSKWHPVSLASYLRLTLEKRSGGKDPPDKGHGVNEPEWIDVQNSPSRGTT